MNAQFNALLLTVACTDYASTAANPVSIVRAQRAEYNAAIGSRSSAPAHVPPRPYHLIAGSSGKVDSGGDAATRGYADEEFRNSATACHPTRRKRRCRKCCQSQ